MVIEVNHPKLNRQFLELPARLYKSDREWVAPLDSDIKSTFDARKNSFFEHGACNRWIALNEHQEVVGRIAAFIDFKKAAHAHTPTGGIGFFDCINNTETAHQLFDAAKNWLHSRSMKCMDGPINLGENDQFWGLLVDGFSAPSFGMNYNPPYYAALFESYGFLRVYDQLTNVLDPRKPLPERFTRISDWVMSKPGYSFKHFKLSDKEKFFEDFREIYNDAWKEFHDFHPLTLDAMRDSFRQMKPLLDEKIIWFAYYENEPIAFVLCMPDANQILRKLNGRMHFVNKLRFLWLKRTVTIDRLRIVVMGCKRRFQNHGLESALIRCLQKEVLPRNTIKEVELAWVGDFNKKMLALHRATGATLAKVHRTYRYNFDF